MDLTPNIAKLTVKNKTPSNSPLSGGELRSDSTNRTNQDFLKGSMKKLLPLLLCFSPYALSDGLPDLGDSSQAIISPIEERQIGKQGIFQLRRNDQLLEDVEVNDYLSQLGRKLVKHSAEPSTEFEFFALNDPSVNAFAMPGGYIGINIGLLLAVQSESELAAVLSHEIAHITQHHLARIIEGQEHDGITSMAAILIALIAAHNNPEASQAAIIGIQAHSLQQRLNYTRTHEEEADRIGLNILQQSDFNTHAMPSFLRRLQRANQFLEGDTPSYLRTHPITSDRVADIANRVAKQPYRLIGDSLSFQLVRTKLLATQKTAREAIRYFNNALNKKRHGNPIAQRYGLVQALLKNNKVQRANQELKKLRKQAQQKHYARNNPMITALTGKVRLAGGNATASLAFYRTAIQDFPQHREMIYEYAELLLQNKQADTTVELLHDQVIRHPSDPKLYDLQALSYAMLGKRLEQHQAQAYSYAWRGDIHGAIEQLELAKQAGGDFHQLSIIESDLRELRPLVSLP
jgi:predicted Zn-dependent protease